MSRLASRLASRPTRSLRLALFKPGRPVYNWEVQRHLIDLDEEAFAAAVAFFSASTRDASTSEGRAIASLQQAKELRERLEIEDSESPDHVLVDGRAEATG
jgi:hypothetical protein